MYLYIKPTNTSGYSLPNSNNPRNIFKNITFTLFKRIRKICTSIIDYYFFVRLLLFQLIKRNYNFIMLLGVLRNVSKIDRKNLLLFKEKDPNFLNNIELYFFYFSNFRL